MVVRRLQGADARGGLCPGRWHFAEGWVAGSRSSTRTLSPSRSEVAGRGGLQGHASCIFRTEKCKGLKPSPRSPHTRPHSTGRGPSVPVQAPRAGGQGAPVLCNRGAGSRSWGRTRPWFPSTCSGPLEEGCQIQPLKAPGLTVIRAWGWDVERGPWGGRGDSQGSWRCLARGEGGPQGSPCHLIPAPLRAAQGVVVAETLPVRGDESLAHPGSNSRGPSAPGPGRGVRVQRRVGCWCPAPSGGSTGAPVSPQQNPGQGLPAQHWAQAWETAGVLAGPVHGASLFWSRGLQAGRGGGGCAEAGGAAPGDGPGAPEHGCSQRKPGDLRRGWGGGRCLTSSRAPRLRPPLWPQTCPLLFP